MRYTGGKVLDGSPSTCPSGWCQNGRELQELVNEAGVRYVNALKRQDSKQDQ
jgi:hypothetical protein